MEETEPSDPAVEEGIHVAPHQNPTFDIQGLNHLALVCSDMQRTVDFYTGILGMRLVKTMEYSGETGNGQHFFFDMGNGRDAIAFFWFENAPPAAPGLAQNGGRIEGAPRGSAIGAMDHVAFDVPRDKIEEYRDKLVEMGVEVTEVVNHSNRPGEKGTRGPSDQYLPDEPTEDTFVRSIYFQDPDGITLEFACWGRPFEEGDIEHEPKTAADLNVEKGVEALHAAAKFSESRARAEVKA